MSHLRVRVAAVITPFHVDIPETDLADLRERLRRTRWPEPETVHDWSQGVPLAYLRDLCGYWADGYDWRATQRRLNALPHYRTVVDGAGIHFVHVRSARPDALPLVLTNGWPGTITEYLEVIEPLAERFHVVCPTLPGYGFSDKPDRTGWGVRRVADAWAELMTRLGYRRFGAAGSDWGTSVSTCLAQQHPDRLAGIHLVPPLAAPDPATFEELTDAERASLADLDEARRTGSGYGRMHATRPQTIGYSLVDSPVGLCAWIAEKYVAWTDTTPSRDQILDAVTIYWLTRSGASSARLYWESFAEVESWFAESTVDTVAAPTGCSIYPAENPRASRRWAERRFTDIRHWHELEAGGHFAALEQPDSFVAELTAFFALVS